MSMSVPLAEKMKVTASTATSPGESGGDGVPAAGGDGGGCDGKAGGAIGKPGGGGEVGGGDMTTSPEPEPEPDSSSSRKSPTTSTVLAFVLGADCAEDEVTTASSEEGARAAADNRTASIES